MTISKKRILANSAYVYIGEVSSKSILFIFNAIAARKLGIVDYGLYIYGMNLGLLLINFVDFGTNNFILKKISEGSEGNREYIWKVVELEIVLSAISILGIAVFITYFETSLYTQIVVIILFFSVIFENITNVFKNVLRALGKCALDASLSVLSSVLRLALGLIFYYLISNIYGISIGVTLSTLVLLVIGLYFMRNIYGTRKEILKHSSITVSLLVIFKSCFIFAVPVIIKGVYFRLDSVLVKSFVDSISLGLYNSVLRLLFVQQFLPSGLIQVIFPYLAKLYYEKNYTQANIFFNKVFMAFTIFFNFIQMVQYIFAESIIKVIYGKEFLGGVVIYKILILSFVFTSLAFLLTFLFMANNKTNLLNKYFIIGTIVKLVLVIALTLKYSIVGTAIAFLVSEIIQFMIFLFASFKNNIKFKSNYITIIASMVIADIGIILWRYI